jgi:hypothetical protein
MRNFIKASLIIIVSIIILETVLRFSIDPNYLNEVKQNEISNRLKRMPTFYQDNFCNPIHKTLQGERLVAKCIQRKFNKELLSLNIQKKTLWTAGASTSFGFNCKSNTSWPLELKKLYPDIKLINLSKNAASMKEVFAILQFSFAKNDFPDALILATPNAAPDFTIEEGSTHRNLYWKIVNISYLIDDFFAENFYSYAWSKNIFLEILGNISQKSKNNLGKKYFSKVARTTLWQQEFYINKLSEVIFQNKISPFCINVPFVKSLQPDSPIYSEEDFNNFLISIQQNMMQLCNKLKIPSIDVQECFDDEFNHKRTSF